MSVLFKALAKAAKTREAVTGTAAPVGQPAILSGGGSSSGGKKRLLLLVGALCIGAAGGSYLFFATDDTPAPARPAPPRPRPPILQTPAQQQAAAQPALAPPPAAAPEPAPPELAPAPVAAAAPVAPSPALSQAQTAPVQSPAPQEQVKVASASPPTKPKQVGPVMPVEDDLPTLLARIRRQKADSAAAEPVAVGRTSGRRDLLDEDGRTAIHVGVAPQSGQDAAHVAYDDLLQGRYDEAVENYDRALKTEPRSAALLLGKATALQKAGRVADARNTYNMVLAIDPRNREALTNQTTLLASQSSERALADLQALKQANPDFSPIDAEIGAQQATLGNIPAAIEALGRAISMSPGNGLYRLNLAILQDRAGLVADAASSYRTALDLLSAGTSGLPLPIDQIRRRLAYLEGK